MNSNTLIIENSHLQGHWRRIGQGIVTLFFWCLWGYLILPLASPLMSYIGVEIAFIHQVDIYILINILIAVLLVSATMIFSMSLWSFYNYLLHLNTHPIQWPIPKVLAKELATDFNVNLLDLAHWQYSKELNIQLNEQGNIQNVKTNYLETAA